MTVNITSIPGPYRPDTTAKRAAALRRLLDHLEPLPGLLADAELDGESLSIDTWFAKHFLIDELQRVEAKLAERWAPTSGASTR